MIDGDVIFDASWIRAWKQQYAFLIGQPVTGAGAGTGEDSRVLNVAEIISPMMAARFGFGLPMPPQLRQQLLSRHGAVADIEQLGELVPAERSPLAMQLSRRLTSNKFTACQCASLQQHEYALAAMALAAHAGHNVASTTDEASGDESPDSEEAKDDEKSDDAKDDEKSDDAKKEEKPEEVKLPEGLINQAIKHVVMHEVGHSLGLRHNFKASAMLSLADLNNPDVTKQQGMVGSVMDYTPLNIARNGE
jgi:hypothetical protein